MAEPAPTRRSSRTSPTPVQATPETPGTGRATVRRQAAGSAPERPAVVWGRPVGAKRADAAAPAAVKPQAPASVTPASDIPAPRPTLSGIDAPAAAAPVLPPVAATPAPVAPAPSSVDLPVASGPVVEPVAPRIRARAAASAVPPVATVEHVSRRTRRAQTGEQPVPAVPPIAPETPAAPERPAAAFEAELPTREEPAPLLDTVLVAAEPFELLEPAVGAVASTEPVDDAPAADTASTWAADSLAKILAAEAAATIASAAPLVETGALQPASAPGAAESLVAEPQPSAAEAQAQPAPRARRAAAASQTPTVQPAAGAPDTAPRQTAAPESKPAETPTSTAQVNADPRPERVGPLTGPIPQPTASDVDEFEAASRLFAFTGETPVQNAAPAGEAEPETDAEPARHTAPRRSPARRGAAFKRVATASFSVGVFGIVGLMAVGMTTPAEAVAAVNGTDASLSVVAVGDNTAPVIDEAEIQAYVAPGDAQNDTLQRTENYTTTTTAQLASEAGIKNFSNLFHNNPNSNVQWPFAVGVTMSYGFGMRSGRMHEGIDFTPGNGAPVQAIADGTVRVASEAGGAYGVHVIIDHVIDGQLFSSHYAHMQYGSLEVTPGQHVTVGTVIGHTGNTGRSYGAHTHFEILKNGTTAIDPWPWLQEYTDGTHTVG
ncbi:peptidoglycan DD-metalloendopeptidase family protein [Microbacterium sp. QXD-8]|uniref:Peptidoglycan DD-metalloendopeptidase family protein n=1 Tax=Microbacterium psychrotolerans TaxID=3068321 RepID=A0ABU0Z4N0_9MICO|nr:peptidoglycan DD-metalloendopeptidase family protein [Microbacterium sp. QXD-8]MDQ7879552.1 peptidoglycan DD-metalloendopeptidase family protein [Microbacterium sp. QXD-8]